MRLRRLLDIRTTPLLIGLMSVSWAMIPLMDVRNRSLFAAAMESTGQEHLWMALMISVGVNLMISAVVCWRNMLLLSEGLAVIMWLGLWAQFIAYAPSPVVMSMPVFAVCCALCLVREVVFGIRVSRIKRDRSVRGFADLQDPA